MKSRKYGTILITVGLVGLCLLWFVPPPFGVPAWVAVGVPARMSLLRSGMTGPQTMSTLGLTGWAPPGMASGPSNRMINGYSLRPGMGLRLVFDGTRGPSQFVDGQVDGINNQDRWGSVALILIIACGLWLLTRQRVVRDK